jgi:HD-like signal output (HDOD) protein
MTVMHSPLTAADLYPSQVELELAFRAVRRARIPQVPDVVLALRDELERPEPRLKVAADLIAQDLALTGQLLKTINSPLFACRTKIASVPQAVSMVGIKRLTNFVTVEAIARILDGAEGTARVVWESIMEEARAFLAIASLVDGVSDDEAYLFGIMHDVGCLIFADLLADYGSAWVLSDASHPERLLAYERSSLGVDHAIVGFLLAGTWRLPQSVALAIYRHHSVEMPAWMDSKARSLVAMAVLAHALVDLRIGAEEFPQMLAECETALAELAIADGDWTLLCERFAAN